MPQIYLDNAATTQIDEDVATIMHEANLNLFGNASSIHALGRKSRAKVELARKNIAKCFNAASNEILFTSGATEANNTVFSIAINDLGITRIITAPTEHAAVLEPLKHSTAEVIYLKVDEKGYPDLNELSSLLENANQKTLVSLMFVNNETGLQINLEQVSNICKKHNALFHSDCVQGIAYYNLDVQALNVDFLTCSAHKFHGPKGIGFLYYNQKHEFSAFLKGGGQERGHRGGTENITGILGLEYALIKAKEQASNNIQILQTLKQHLLDQLVSSGLEYKINGDISSSSPAITNISFNTTKDVSMLLFNLDLAGVLISGGSACTSGSNKGSHVLQAMGVSMKQPALRISFSKYNVKSDIDHFIKTIQVLLT